MTTIYLTNSGAFLKHPKMCHNFLILKSREAKISLVVADCAALDLPRVGKGWRSDDKPYPGREPPEGAIHSSSC